MMLDDDTGYSSYATKLTPSSSSGAVCFEMMDIFRSPLYHSTKLYLSLNAQWKLLRGLTSLLVTDCEWSR